MSDIQFDAEGIYWPIDGFGARFKDSRLTKNNALLGNIEVFFVGDDGMQDSSSSGEFFPNNYERVATWLSLVDPSMGLTNLGTRYVLALVAYEKDRLLEEKKKEKEKAAPKAKDAIQLAEDDWTNELHYDARGRKVNEDVHNITMALEHHKEWRNRFSYDSFLNQILIDGARSVGDPDIARIIRWFGKNDPFQFSGNYEARYERSVYSTAIQKTFDPLYDWITSLEWDGTPRLRTWMKDMCGAPDTAHTAWVGYMTIMEMTARALNPGCMGRQVPVWEGAENKGKTRMIKLLGDPWSITFDMSMESKEAHMAVQGVWLAELAELDTLRKTSESRLKSFISQTNDTFIPKYSNNRATYHRRTVFIGTTNDDDYLPPTGAGTRWYPIRTGAFNIELLQQERHQLFAESVSIFKDSPDTQWWEEPASLKKEIADSRRARRPFNPYEAGLAEHLNGKGETSWKDIAEGYLELRTPAEWKDKSLQGQVTNALKALGWTKSHREGGNYWVAPKEDPS